MSKSGQKNQRTAKSTKRSAAHRTTNFARRATNTNTTHRTTRHIPAAIRREVFERDGHRCTYEGPTGRRCDSTHDLQLDHIHPWGCGGATKAENLRVLCSTHNRHRNLTTKEPAPRYAGLDNQKCLAWTSAPEVNNGRTQPHPTSAPEVRTSESTSSGAEQRPATSAAEVDYGRKPPRSGVRLPPIPIPTASAPPRHGTAPPTARAVRSS